MTPARPFWCRDGHGGPTGKRGEEEEEEAEPGLVDAIGRFG